MKWVQLCGSLNILWHCPSLGLLLKLTLRTLYPIYGLPRWGSSKESTCQCKRCQFDPWFRKISWRGKWHATPVFLPGKFCSQRSLMGYSPWGRKESDTAEWLSMHILYVCVCVCVCIYIYIYLYPLKIFIYFWLCWVCVAMRGLSLVIESWGCSPVVVHELLIVVASPVGEHEL